MGITGQHMDCLDLFSRNLKLDHFLGPDLAFLDQAVAGNDDEELPLAVVPVLALGDAGLGDVHRKLPVIDRFQQFGKAAPRIAVHLQIKGDLLFRKVTEIHGIQLLLKTARRDLRHDQRLRLVAEGMQALHNVAQGGLVRDWRVAVLAVLLWLRRQAVKAVFARGGILAAVGMPFYGVKHLFDQIIDEQDGTCLSAAAWKM